ncbi:MAG: NTP transferase domain-containing protein [Geobacteraceae bacterium]|nr:NTP transferase domain-containing protein [Geobacteraceae bacterium]
MERRLAAIVLAAGYSSRMGEFKPLLTFGGTPVLERVVYLFQEVGIEDVRVVLGHRSAELYSLVERLGARPVFNDRFEDGMFSSVLAGVKTLDEDVAAFFLLPVDIPLVRHATVKMLLQAYRSREGGVFYPVFYGKRGHPPLVSGRYREEILAWSGDGGLKGVLSRHADEAVDVETGDETILLDMDTPAQYERLRGLWLRESCLLPNECEELLVEKFAVARPVLDHCRSVAKLAVLVAAKLNEAGCCIDVGLVEAASLLHDLAKGQPDHAAKGAGIVADMGFVDLARLIAVHMDIRVAEGDLIVPAEILYLADKLVSKSSCGTLEMRFAPRLHAHLLDSEIRGAVIKRLENAQLIKEKIENKLGRLLYDLLREYNFM